MDTLYDFLADEQESYSVKSKSVSTKDVKLTPFWRVPPGSDVVTDADYFATQESRKQVYYADPDWATCAKQSTQWAKGCDTEINLMKHPTIGMSVGAALTLIKRYEVGSGSLSKVCCKLSRQEAVDIYRDQIEEMLVDGFGHRGENNFPMKKSSHIRKWRIIRNILVDVVGVPWPSKATMEDQSSNETVNPPTSKPITTSVTGNPQDD